MTVTLENPPTQPPQPRSKGRGLIKRLAVLALVVLAGITVAWVGVSMLRPHFYSGQVLQATAPAPSMSELSYASGDSVDLDSYDGDVVLVYFGYTNCPDVCPTTLSAVARAREDMSPSQRDRTHLLMVSVDPTRDDPESLQQYVEFYDQDFLGVGGEVVDIDRVASLYGIFYELGEGDAESGYVVDHTGSLMGIGTDGTLRLLWAPGVSAANLSADIKELLS